MNRDELRSRLVALPPVAHEAAGIVAVFPNEPGGGTWIGINNAGICLALINWHALPAKPVTPGVSRGIVVKELIQLVALEDLARLLKALPLDSMPAFRLIAVASRETWVREFQWDQRKVIAIQHSWVPRHWFSSGMNEKFVELERAEVCRRAWTEPGAGELSWLRRLHRSHRPHRGRLSICMHGQEANTVSYTEIAIRRTAGMMRYHPGPLCDGEEQFYETTFLLAA
jgi:hypothetical protein